MATISRTKRVTGSAKVTKTPIKNTKPSTFGEAFKTGMKSGLANEVNAVKTAGKLAVKAGATAGAAAGVARGAKPKVRQKQSEHLKHEVTKTPIKYSAEITQIKKSSPKSTKVKTYKKK